jgi:hypothetical protein
MATKKKPTKARKPSIKKPLGPYVIVRSDRAGVFAGELAAHVGTDVTLNACRRLWYWKANAGVALSGVAMTGLASGCKVDVETNGHFISGVLEVIPCAPDSETSIRAYK